jgi:protein KTI12
MCSGELKSAAEHRLSAESYVILDSLNYIKGYRYELYCSARTFRTAHCVVWVEATDEASDRWNSARLAAGKDGYSEAM